MSNFHHNIAGCLQYEDYTEAAKWLSKAQISLIPDDYSTLVLKLDKAWPYLFSRGDFQQFKVNVTNLDFKKTEIIDALSGGNYEYAREIYSTYFTYQIFPEFVDLLNKYTKQNSIKSFNRSVKESLSSGEIELLLDMETHLEHPDKPFYRRVKSTLADFYITKASHYGLSLHKPNGRTLRHLPWDHTYARSVLSAELGESINLGVGASGSLGTVSLIGDFTPKENDLTDAKYFTSKGRDYFASALDVLTGGDSTAVHKIDVDNFMKMKEVIPTASQMKAIYGQDNYIIDGPAGTGKSTTLLQKLLILTNHNNVKSSEILVLVKHDGLVAPFKQLLLDMNIMEVNIDSVSNFLFTKLGSGVDKVSQSELDRAECDAKELTEALDIILSEEILDDDIIDYLPPKLIDRRSIQADLEKYYYLKRDIKLLDLSRTEKETQIREAIKKDLNSQSLIEQDKEYSISEKFERRKGLKLDLKDGKTLKNLERKYNDINNIKLSSPASEHSLYEPIIESIKKEFTLLEQSMMGRNSSDKLVSLGSYIEAKIKDKVDVIEKVWQKKMADEVSQAFDADLDLQANKEKYLKSYSSLQLTETKVNKLIWGKALLVNSSLQKKLMHLFANKGESAKQFQTIIIDEAQDVTKNCIEMVNCFGNQLILAGDEAQKENTAGLGYWKNLRTKIGFEVDDKLSIYKLRHNFRQTYELGNLSYNYRQLLLEQSIENLEADYFENQKGFSIPSIVSIDQLNDLVKNKLEFIADEFRQKFPLVIIAEDVLSQKEIAAQLVTQGLTVSIDQDSKNVEVIVVLVDKIAGREFPVVISMVTNKMAVSTIYIILSRAKFDLTLAVPGTQHINTHLHTLSSLGMISFAT